jgi:hypothetical protein
VIRCNNYSLGLQGAGRGGQSKKRKKGKKKERKKERRYVLIG